MSSLKFDAESIHLHFQNILFEYTQGPEMNFIQVPNHKLQGQRQASCENFVESFCKDNGIVTEKPLKCNRSCSHSKMV